MPNLSVWTSIATSDAHVVDAGAVGEIAQRLGARLAGAQLEVDQPQLVGELRVRERELRADALNRLVEAEPRFDADDEQVERVGQRRAGSGAARRLAIRAEHHAGQEVAERRSRRARAVRFGWS